jgi:hypothetical protein
MPKVSIEQSIPEWSVTQTSTANTVLTLTKTAVNGHKHVITGFEVVLSGSSAGQDISIELKDGSTAKYKTMIGKDATVGTRVHVRFTYGIEMSEGTAANLSVAAGGSSAVTTGNMTGYTKVA